MAKWWKLGIDRLIDRFRGGREDKAVKETPAPPAQPPTPPEGPAEAGPPPPAAPEAEPGEEGNGGEGGGGVEPPPERIYPPFLHVSADGSWVISDTEWEGTMSGTLHGADVKTFIDAIEAGDYATAIPLIADAYGIPGGLIDMQRSTVYNVTY